MPLYHMATATHTLSFAWYGATPHQSRNDVCFRGRWADFEALGPLNVLFAFWVCGSRDRWTQHVGWSHHLGIIHPSPALDEKNATDACIPVDTKVRESGPGLTRYLVPLFS